MLHQVDKLKSRNPNYDEIFKSLKLLIRNADQSDFAIDLILPKKSTDEYEARYNNIRNQIINLYGFLITDLDTLCEFLQHYPKEKEKQKIYTEYHINKTLSSPETPLTKIIIKYKDEDISLNKDRILHELVYEKSNEIADLKEKLKEAISDLIQYKNKQLEHDFYSNI